MKGKKSTLHFDCYVRVIENFFFSKSFFCLLYKIPTTVLVFEDIVKNGWKTMETFCEQLKLYPTLQSSPPSFSLSTTDQIFSCQYHFNSVFQSSFSYPTKTHFLNYNLKQISLIQGFMFNHFI